MTNPRAPMLLDGRYTATTNSWDQENLTWRGVHLFLRISEVSGTTPTLDIKIQAKDTPLGTYYDLSGASFTQKTSAVSDDLLVYPGVSETANRKVSGVLPVYWRVVATIGGTSPSFTFTLVAHCLP